MLAVCWLAVVLGCSSQEISLGKGKGPDADVAAPTFSAPSPLVAIAVEGGRDDDPSLSADLRLLFFNSRREGGSGKEDIWFSSRNEPADGWGAPEPVASLNTEDRETGISLAPDGLSLWFSSDRAGGKGGLDIYMARRSSRAAEWEPPQHVSELSSEGDDLISAVSNAGRTAYLARRADDDDDYDLFVARRTAVGEPWGSVEALGSLNGDEAESDAFPFAEERALVLTRDEDLWLAQRASGTDDWQLIGALASLNSDDDDRDAWLAQDGRYIVFSSNRMGNYMLFEAQR